MRQLWGGHWGPGLRELQLALGWAPWWGITEPCTFQNCVDDIITGIRVSLRFLLQEDEGGLDLYPVLNPLIDSSWAEVSGARGRIWGVGLR